MSGVVAHNLSGLICRWETTNETDKMAIRLSENFVCDVLAHHSVINVLALNSYLIQN